MTKILTHSSFLAKAIALFLVLIIGSYADFSQEEKTLEKKSSTLTAEKYNEIDANNLIRTVSYRNNAEPILTIRKK